MHFAGAMGGVSLENTCREPETSVRTTVTSCHSLALALQVIGNACPQSPAIDSVNRAGAGLRHAAASLYVYLHRPANALWRKRQPHQLLATPNLCINEKSNGVGSVNTLQSHISQREICWPLLHMESSCRSHEGARDSSNFVKQLQYWIITSHGLTGSPFWVTYSI